MQIEKILNNNVVVAVNDGKEQVIMGRGIAFKASVGSKIDESKIQKIFILKNHQEMDSLLKTIQDIPMIYLQITDEILKIGSENNHSLKDTLFFSIADHIEAVVERAKKGIQLKNPLLPDIRRFYSSEFLLGQKAVVLLNKTFDIQLCEDEASFLAMHFVGFYSQNEEDLTYQLTGVIQDIFHVVTSTLHIDMDEESANYYRFLMHLRLFAQRLLSNATYTGDENEELLLSLKKKYADAYACSLKIKSHVQEKYNYIISNEELLYLTIHISRILMKK
ncbi:MAG: PRD domain-containing protein [Lachnospiraceae bacterium]|nr:PRD domain-containing protein [Lachnospiraceae bacterium]